MLAQHLAPTIGANQHVGANVGPTLGAYSWGNSTCGRTCLPNMSHQQLHNDGTVRNLHQAQALCVQYQPSSHQTPIAQASEENCDSMIFTHTVSPQWSSTNPNYKLHVNKF